MSEFPVEITMADVLKSNRARSIGKELERAAAVLYDDPMSHLLSSLSTRTDDRHIFAILQDEFESSRYFMENRANLAKDKLNYTGPLKDIPKYRQGEHLKQLGLKLLNKFNRTLLMLQNETVYGIVWYHLF